MQSQKIESKKKNKQALVFMIGTALAGFISLLNAPVLTRCLTADSYILYSMFISLSTVINAIAYLGYDSSYMRFYHKNYGIKYLLICMKKPVLLLLVFSIIIFCSRNSLLKYILGETISVWECLLLCLYLYVKMIARFTLLTMRMEGHAWNYVISDCLERALFIGIIIIKSIVSAAVSFSDVLLAFSFGYFIEVLINYVKFPKTIRSIKTKNKIETREAELYKFGIFLGLSSSLMFCIPLIQKIVVRSQLSTNEAAVFFAASIFATAISLISISVNNVWEPQVYKTTNEGGNLKPSFHLYGILLSWVLLTVLGMVILFRRYLVFILSDSYHDVYIIAPCITFSAIMTIIYNFYSIGIEIKKTTWIRSVIPIIELILSVLMLYLITPILGIKGAAIAMLLGSVISKIIGITFGLKLYDTGRSMKQSVICWTISFSIAIASLFFTQLYQDIFLSIVAVFGGLIVVRKEIKGVTRRFKRNETQQTID